jgi:hypothetical protein
VICHTIAPYAEPVAPPAPVYPITTFQGQPFIPINSERGKTYYGIDTKIGYAQYIGQLTMGVGDWLVPKTAAFPFHDYSFFQVESIQEVHYLAHWNRAHDNKYPYCLHLKSSTGSMFWACPEHYIKVSTRPSDAWGQPHASPV